MAKVYKKEVAKKRAGGFVKNMAEMAKNAAKTMKTKKGLKNFVMQARSV